VLGILVESLDLVARRTRPVLAQTTLPRSTQETLTVGVRTRSNKGAALRTYSAPPAIDTSLELILVPKTRRQIYIQWSDYLELIRLLRTAQDERLELVLSAKVDHKHTEWGSGYLAQCTLLFFELCINLGLLFDLISEFFLKFDIGLGRRHKAPLPLEEEVLSPLLISDRDEFRSKITHEDITGPALMTGHAVRILCSGYEIVLMTAGTRDVGTIGTIDLLVV